MASPPVLAMIWTECVPGGLTSIVSTIGTKPVLYIEREQHKLCNWAFYDLHGSKKPGLNKHNRVAPSIPSQLIAISDSPLAVHVMVSSE